MFLLIAAVYRRRCDTLCTPAGKRYAQTTAYAPMLLGRSAKRGPAEARAIIQSYPISASIRFREKSNITGSKILATWKNRADRQVSQDPSTLLRRVHARALAAFSSPESRRSLAARYQRPPLKSLMVFLGVALPIPCLPARSPAPCFDSSISFQMAGAVRTCPCGYA